MSPDEFNLSVSQGPLNPQARRAAALVWTLGFMQVALCGCCVVSGMLLLGQSDQELQSALSQQARTNDPALLRRLVQMVIVVTMALGVLPGLGYLVLGFGVRQRKPLAINTTLLLGLTQVIVIGVLLLMASLESIIARNPMGFTVNAIIFGTPLALLAYTIRLLLRLRGGDDELNLDRDPWNQPNP